MNSVHDFCLAKGGGSRRMGAKRVMEGAGLSFCLCQQHIGEKSKSGAGVERAAGAACAAGDALWQGETEWCKDGWKKVKEM